MFDYYKFNSIEVYDGFVDTNMPNLTTEKNNAANYNLVEYDDLPPINIIASIVKHNIEHNIKSFPLSIQNYFKRLGVGTTLDEILSHKMFKDALHLNDGNKLYNENCQHTMKQFDSVKDSIPCYERPFKLNIYTNAGDIYSYAFETKDDAINFCENTVITQELLTEWNFIYE